MRVLSLADALSKSSSLTLLYRLYILADLWPTIFMAVTVSTPALRRFVAAQCLRSWNRKFWIAGSFKAVLNAFLTEPTLRSLYKNTLLVNRLLTLNKSDRAWRTLVVRGTKRASPFFVSLSDNVINPLCQSTLSQVKFKNSPNRIPNWEAISRMGFRRVPALSYSLPHSSSPNTLALSFLGSGILTFSQRYPRSIPYAQKS